MSETPVVIAHLSDLHFGGYADLAQIEALEDFVPSLGTAAVVVSGDLTQRARHGEFQAAHAFLNRLRSHLPLLVIPGNHDIEWWKSPFGLMGRTVKYAKYSSYFSPLTPVLEVPGAVIAGALSAFGVAFGSLTWNLRDVAVKGHLPASETARVKAIFDAVPPGVVKILTLHHNVLPGGISRRMGLASWRSAHRRLLATGADAILCGHDHQEGAGQVRGTLPVSTAGTHSFRTRHGRASVFNVVSIDSRAVHVQHYRWESSSQRFLKSDTSSFARQGASTPAVSVAGEERDG
jgi:3',5'-cyclic AMP phosphodiesterase CpdA